MVWKAIGELRVDKKFQQAPGSSLMLYEYLRASRKLQYNNDITGASWSVWEHKGISKGIMMLCKTTGIFRECRSLSIYSGGFRRLFDLGIYR